MRLMVELPPEDVDIESFQQSKKLEKIADQEQVLVEEDVLNLVKFDNRLYGVVVKVGKIQGVDVHLGLRVDDWSFFPDLIQVLVDIIVLLHLLRNCNHGIDVGLRSVKEEVNHIEFVVQNWVRRDRVEFDPGAVEAMLVFKCRDFLNRNVEHQGFAVLLCDSHVELFQFGQVTDDGVEVLVKVILVVVFDRRRTQELLAYIHPLPSDEQLLQLNLNRHHPWLLLVRLVVRFVVLVHVHLLGRDVILHHLIDLVVLMVFSEIESLSLVGLLLGFRRFLILRPEYLFEVGLHLNLLLVLLVLDENFEGVNVGDKGLNLNLIRIVEVEALQIG